jgi:uncharacterized repeat protein (TIGR03803 family)
MSKTQGCERNPSPRDKGELPMPDKKIFIQMILLAMFAAATFMVTVRAFAQTETVLHNFAQNNVDGYIPQAGLTLDAAGNLYGTTSSGGAYGVGAVFELRPAAGGGWTEHVLYSFNNTGTNGYDPFGGVILDAGGNLYGTAAAGGTYSRGTVFELVRQPGGGWSEKTLHNFASGSDGAYPYGNLTFDASGNLYGTAYYGGANNDGIVYELKPNSSGGWAEKVLHSFNGTDGRTPLSGVIFDASGNLYDTTNQGSLPARGTVFELKPIGGGAWSEHVLHNFSANGTDGTGPYGSLIFDSAGNLYGTTVSGGVNGKGILFELTPGTSGAWTESILHNFPDSSTDGNTLFAGLISDTAGNLYGVSAGGGVYGGGTIFKFTPAGGGSWTETVLHSFGNGTDGSDPFAVTLDGSGNLFGTTTYGGPNACNFIYTCGSVFEITP